MKKRKSALKLTRLVRRAVVFNKNMSTRYMLEILVSSYMYKNLSYYTPGVSSLSIEPSNR